MDSSFITLHRKITQWEWYDEPNTFRLFIHLLLIANHKKSKWRGHSVNRGQVITGRKALSSALNLSPQQIRTSLNKLKSTNEITTQATNEFSLITLVKYSDYQSKQVRATSEITSQPTNEQQTNNKRITTNNNENNGNNGNNNWVIPLWINKKAWQEFEQHRKKLKPKTWTNLARTKLANLIKDYNHEDQQQLINKSIIGGYPSVYPDKQKNFNNNESSTRGAQTFTEQ